MLPDMTEYQEGPTVASDLTQGWRCTNKSRVGVTSKIGVSVPIGDISELLCFSSGRRNKNVKNELGKIPTRRPNVTTTSPGFAHV